MNYIVCHYSEISLKGKNRDFFEKKLVENIKKSLKEESLLSVSRERGRVVLKIEKEGEIKEKLRKVPGVAYFYFGVKEESSLEKIISGVKEILKEKDFSYFRITTRRSDKKFPSTSPEVNKKVGEVICRELVKKVDLKNPDIECFIEITEKGSYIYTDKVRGYGGLPVGSSGKAVCLLSGGIDSPVAVFKMMKRGLKPVLVHFHAHPYLPRDSISKAKKIHQKLKEFYPEIKLYLIPLGDLQKEVVLLVPSKLRIIFYRREMYRIAQMIPIKEKAKGLVTGESLGQVSSQTLENIGVLDQVVNIPILRPLIGENKEEIISLSKEIETYPISILPDQDCCTLFNPSHPETKAELKRVLEVEEKMSLSSLRKDTFENKVILT